ncbi:MAG: polysaccharide biosynthesis protein [Lachnospiraceae bacterium]|nr:polysaccharide biosynthesis protein [Lachnospiraceae bacterium]
MRFKKDHDWSWIRREVMLGIMDAIIIAFSYFFALWARFDFRFSTIDPIHIENYSKIIIPYIIAAIVIMWICRLYHSIWRFASFFELSRLVQAWIIFQVFILVFYYITKIRMPLSFWAMGGVLCFVLTAALRFSYRFLRMLKGARAVQGKDSYEKVMVIGAGSAGKEVIHEYVTSKYLNSRVCCIIDDNPVKKGRYLDGVPIVGNRYAIPEMVEKYGVNKIIFAIPTSSGDERREILELCTPTGCKVQIVPGIYQLVDGSVSIAKIRDVEVEDLLGREPVKVDLNEIHKFIHDKVVLVTGGGGSIGSELCRQIAASGPRMLIIFDIFENNAYWIQQELKARYGDGLNFVTLIGSVRDSKRVNSIMEEYRPEIVFHAAAHKHVPLMEGSPNEAIKNNVMGTFNVAEAALKYGVKSFVLISTDKAVNPTNIMGASKRICEMIIQMMDRKAQKLDEELGSAERTHFVAVRFGNVLGSSGSVIPLFKKQIEEGGPVTVTHKDVIRYFMTIPEAVSLVLQAGYYSGSMEGNIMVLDMGKPVRIDDMARNLIRLSGHEPDKDIRIVYTGLRPGEKLYEERLMDEEGLRTTTNKLISIGSPIPMDDEKFCEDLKRLGDASIEESGGIRDAVAAMVPTYRPRKVSLPD